MFFHGGNDSRLAEAVRAGTAGLVHEASLYHGDWGFELAAIQTATAVWHGAGDRQATPAWGSSWPTTSRLPR
jgi:hypothetical protein